VLRAFGSQTVRQFELAVESSQVHLRRYRRHLMNDRIRAGLHDRPDRCVAIEGIENHGFGTLDAQLCCLYGRARCADDGVARPLQQWNELLTKRPSGTRQEDSHLTQVTPSSSAVLRGCERLVNNSQDRLGAVCIPGNDVRGPYVVCLRHG
jgi:hypothetical protein